MSSLLRKLSLILLLAAGLVLLAVQGRRYSLRLEAEHWRRQLAAASDQDAVILVRSTSWDQDSLPLSLLVEALNAPRTCVAEAAGETLRQTIGHWRTLAAGQRLARCDDLAAALVDEAPRFDSRACREAVLLISQILQTPWKGSLAERGRTIAICQRALAALGDRDRRIAVERPAPAIAPPDDAGSTVARPLSGCEPAPLTAGVDALSQLPGGALPVETFALPQLPVITPQQTADANARVEPAPLKVPEQPQLLAPQSPGQRSTTPGATTALTNAWRPPPRGAGNPVKATSLADFRSRMGITSAVAVTGLENSQTMDLMRQLQSSDPTISGQARLELMQRGFSEFHLKFARKLFDPDPAVRKEMAQMLPSTPGVDAAPWLLHLCHDDDPEVRFTAVSLIVTTANPALLEEAEALARADSDPRIQEQAERIAQFRRLQQRSGRW